MLESGGRAATCRCKLGAHVTVQQPDGQWGAGTGAYSGQAGARPASSPRRISIRAACSCTVSARQRRPWSRQFVVELCGAPIRDWLEPPAPLCREHLCIGSDPPGIRAQLRESLPGLPRRNPRGGGVVRQQARRQGELGLRLALAHAPPPVVPRCPAQQLDTGVEQAGGEQDLRAVLLAHRIDDGPDRAEDHVGGLHLTQGSDQVPPQEEYVSAVVLGLGLADTSPAAS